MENSKEKDCGKISNQKGHGGKKVSRKTVEETVIRKAMEKIVRKKTAEKTVIRKAM